jgi:hypothetical protein
MQLYTSLPGICCLCWSTMPSASVMLDLSQQDKLLAPCISCGVRKVKWLNVFTSSRHAHGMCPVALAAVAGVPDSCPAGHLARSRLHMCTCAVHYAWQGVKSLSFVLQLSHASPPSAKLSWSSCPHAPTLLNRLHPAFIWMTIQVKINCQWSVFLAPLWPVDARTPTKCLLINKVGCHAVPMLQAAVTQIVPNHLVRGEYL